MRQLSDLRLISHGLTRGTIPQEALNLLETIPSSEILVAYRKYQSSRERHTDSALSPSSLDNSLASTPVGCESSSPNDSTTSSGLEENSDQSPVDAPIEHAVSPNTSVTSSTSHTASSSHPPTSSQHASTIEPTSPSAAHFQCPGCSKTWPSREKLNKHINQVHRPRFRCDEPGCAPLKPFGLREGLTRHREAAHPELYPSRSRKTMRCPCTECGATIRGRLDNFWKHLRRVHGLGVDEARAIRPI